MAFSVQNLRFLVRGGLLAALKAAIGATLRPQARELTIATDAKSMRVGDGLTEYASLSVLNPVVPSFQYLTDTGSTADSDPGAGLMKWNHATQASATVLYFDNTTNGTGTDLSTFFTSLQTAQLGFVHMVLEEDRTKWQLWKWTAITTASGYWKFTVTLQASTSTLSDNLPVRVTFTPMSGSTAGSTVWATVKKTTAQAKTSNTTLANDNELVFTCAAGKTYAIKLALVFNTNATADFKYALAYTGTFSLAVGRRVRQLANTPIGTDNELTVTEDYTATIGTAIPLTNTSGGYGLVEVRPFMFTTTTGGTFSVQWAQNTSDPNPTTVVAGCTLEYLEM